MGRSRKPLTGQPVRGFESHPLRHCFAAIVLSYLPAGAFRGRKHDRETDISTEQPSPQADPWLPGADADSPWAGRHRPPAPEGPQAPVGLMSGTGLPASPGSQRLLPEQRLRRRADYLRCYRTGRRRHGAMAILYFVPNQLGHPRLGITASRKVGPAVVRHRIKRRIKETYRRWNDRGKLPALDLVVHLKPEARASDFAALQSELLRLLSGVLPREAQAR